MSYLVFARKWRPQNFDEVIGQEHITTTIKNAISLNRVAHAYLFSGPRGIGKTSTARIFARALNCEKGPIAFPCNVCDFCQEISGGRSLDVIEIDGASNRGIERIRQLREDVKFAPAKCRFKIYIIDEVHQITTDGFNALLKTLEEPPAHVKFIFATTQPHKVLPTILSRCQRFDFKPLSNSLIVEKLKRIIKAEKLDVSSEAFLYIARAASGSMRDAESILDQLSSFCEGQLKIETVTQVLGMIDLESLQELTQMIIERKSAQALSLVEKIINEGKDLPQFIASLLEYFRHILVTKMVDKKNTHQLINLPKEQIARIAEQAEALTLEDVFYIFNVLVRTQEHLRGALSARVVVEMAIVRLTQRESLLSLEKILARLTSLERSLTELEGTVKDNPGKEETRAYIQSNSFHTQKPTTSSDNTGKSQIPMQIQGEQNTLPLEDESTSTALSFVADLKQSWPHFLQAIKEEKVSTATYLEFGEIAGLENETLTITFPEKYNFYKEALERPDNKQLIETKAKEVFGRNLKVSFVLNKISPTEVSKEKLQSKDEAKKKISVEPIIQSALKIFHGRIIRRNSE